MAFRFLARALISVLAARGTPLSPQVVESCAKAVSESTTGQMLLQQGVAVQGGLLMDTGSEALTRGHATPQELMQCPGGAAVSTQCMTGDDYDTAVSSVRSLLESLSDTCTVSDCEQADWAGCVLRMAGHDFMDFANGEGGSDACTDMSDPDNSGLQACLRNGEHGISLLAAYQIHCTTISLADFLVIAAEAVMMSTRAREQTVNPSAAGLDFRSRFRFGRRTVSECAFAAGRLPDPEGGCDAVDEAFVQRMGLSWSGAAALMGVHTLGRAHVTNSGYHGWWSDPENSRRFNNNYFVSLVAKGWIPELSVSGNSQKNQWERSDLGKDVTFDGHEMMLNTDLCLVFHENAGRNSGPVIATQHDCCAWLESRAIIDVVNDNGGVYCGGTPLRGRGGASERGQCCNGDEAANDCGSRNAPTGPAAQEVLTFAADEDEWLSSFIDAWHTVTENGFSASLHSLGECPTSSATSSTSSSSATASETTTASATITSTPTIDATTFTTTAAPATTAATTVVSTETTTLPVQSTVVPSTISTTSASAGTSTPTGRPARPPGGGRGGKGGGGRDNAGR